MEATLSIADVAEAIDVEPVIDLTKSTNPHSLLLNVQAELQIMENRERNLRRRSVGIADMAVVRVRQGFDYTPGVGWHVHAEPERPKAYMGALCECSGCMPDHRDRHGRVKTFGRPHAARPQR